MVDGSELATLHIERVAGRRRDKVRRYRIVLDNQPIGNIRESESLDFDVAPGRHTLHLRLDWTTSPEFAFDAESEDSVSFVCGPGGRPDVGRLEEALDVARDLFLNRKGYIHLELLVPPTSAG